MQNEFDFELFSVSNLCEMSFDNVFDAIFVTSSNWQIGKLKTKYVIRFEIIRSNENMDSLNKIRIVASENFFQNI